MGGGYYEREMENDIHDYNYTTVGYNEGNIIPNDFNNNKIFGGEGTVIGRTNSFSTYNSKRNKIGRHNGLHPTLDPRNYKQKNMQTNCKNPIVFALDVTGSMCEWPQIIYDKMPMFFGQILQNGYLNDMQISFCAVSDYGDEISLQVTEFSNAPEIDERISLLYFGGGMGPLVRHEAYELAGFFYSYMVDLSNAHLPFFFLTCDEDFYPEIPNYKIIKKLGREPQFDVVKGKKIFQDLVKKYNVFIIKKPYNDKNIEQGEIDQWQSAVGKERILIIDNPKASIDLIMGAIAVTNGRSLEEYCIDMEKRGQTNERISHVKLSLKAYYEAMKEGKIKIIKNSENLNYEKNEDNTNKTTSEEDTLSKDNNKDIETNKEKRLKTFYETFKGVDFYHDDYLNELNKNYEKVDSEFNGKIPEELLCPLTRKLFVEPVKLNDGSIFELQAISRWCEMFDVHPITDKKIQDKNFIKNYKTIYKVNEYFETVKNLI